MIDALKLPDARRAEDEWQRLRVASTRLLLVDFDGTLAPFVVERQRARALPAALAALGEIAETGLATVGVLSGRPLAELAELLPHPEFALVGEHGWEERLPGRAPNLHELSPSAEVFLADAERRVAELGDEVRIERKRTSLVVHTRGLSAPVARLFEEEAARRWSELGSRAELRLQRIDGGCELRAVGRDKRAAVATVRAAVGGAPYSVCLGDDVTDEDAFRAVAPFGLGILVGDRPRRTAARARLPNPYAVAEYLALWPQRLSPAKAAAR